MTESDDIVGFIVDLPRSEIKSPEALLMRAILEDGIYYYLRYAPLRFQSRRSARLFEETSDWIFSDDTSYVCSFSNICHVLGIEPGYIRMGLTKVLNNPSIDLKQQLRRRSS